MPLSLSLSLTRSLRVHGSPRARYWEIRLAKRDAIQKKRKATLFWGTRRIQGVFNIVTVLRHSRDTVKLRCFTPSTCASFETILGQERLVTIVEAARQQTANRALAQVSKITSKNVYKKDFMEALVNKLMYVKKRGKTIMKISKRTSASQGKVLLKTGLKITDGWYIVSMSEHQGSFEVKAYHPPTCFWHTYRLTLDRLYQFFHVQVGTPNNLRPHLLRDENRGDLSLYVGQRLYMCSGDNCMMETHRPVHKAGHSVLMMDFEVSELEKHRYAQKIQHMFMYRKARLKFQWLLAARFERHWDATSGQYFYLNKLTGESHWFKPEKLGNATVADAADGWVEYFDEEGNKYYYHARTGRYSYLSEEEAAVRLQRLYRKKRLAEFKIADLGQLVRALRFQMETKDAFDRNPNRLSAVVNFAIYLHTIEKDMAEAGKIFQRAHKMAPRHPVLLFAYGVYQLALNKYPRKKHAAEAHKMLGLASQLDPTGGKFKLAEKGFYHWGVVADPKNPMSLLNYALVQQVVVHDYDKAEKLYHMALTLDMEHKSLRINLEELITNRLPGGLYASKGPSLSVKVRYYGTIAWLCCVYLHCHH